MRIDLLKKTSVLIALSTASIYYAQQDTTARSKDIEQVVLTGVADIAKERKTPVAVSTIKEAQIVERLGNQEFPEILKSTPSVYATKGGGGFGDGRMNIRGFDTNNTAVMINGVPVNDMEGGTVYWSNWAGLSDVTSAMQIQRGLGASKLAIASVGGTVNIVTRSADKKREGNVTLTYGNNGYLKTLFSYNTGKSASGWSTSFLMSRSAGRMYVDGSDFEGYNYYFALGYQPNAKHDFQFTMTGAPQWHMQNFQSSIATYLDMGDGKLDGFLAGSPNRRYNSNWGYYKGDIFTQSQNFYSKPVASVNWDWKMSEKSKLSSVLYASWGRGGGTGMIGSINGKNVNALPKSIDGLIRWDDIALWNQGGTVAAFGANNLTPGTATRTNGLLRRASINSHDWYGFLTNFQHKLNENLNFSIGLDGRYYYGYHPGIVTNFIGNTRYFEKDNFNIPGGYYVTAAQNAVPSANPFAKAVKDENQIAYRNYDGEVMWLGTFGQLEYTKDAFSAFLQGSISEQGFQRIDKWIVDGVTTQTGQKVNQKTGFKYIMGYNAKGGVNYNIDARNNVFVNLGYYSKQPNNYAVYPYPLTDGRATGSQQILNRELANEKIASAELGYGYKSRIFNANLNLYYTSWKDRYQRFTNLPNIPIPGTNPVTNYSRPYANVTGIEEIHMGVEFEGQLKPTENLTINGMFSIGDWHYKGNPAGNIYDENGTPILFNGSPDVKLAFDKVKISDAAQTTAALGVTYKPVKALSVFGNWNYYGNYYGLVNFNGNYLVQPDGTITAAAQKGALKYPDYNLFDAGLSYTFNMGGNDRLILTGNVYNLFDTIYFSDGKSSVFPDDVPTTLANGQANSSKLTYQQLGMMYKGVANVNTVYFGAGRTWAASISFRF